MSKQDLKELPKDSMFFGFAETLTKEQRFYVDSIFKNQVTMVNAKSGTGKTTLAVACAKMIGKPLIYVFAPVEEGKMGYRPGTQQEKERSYIVPLLDALKAINEDPQQCIYSEENTEAQKSGKAWVYPISHIFTRGMNIKYKTVIIDEAQNFTASELKKVFTRIHDSCKVIVIGHSGQIDLYDKSQSGFIPYINHLKDKDYVSICNLSVNFRGRFATDSDLIDVHTY